LNANQPKQEFGPDLQADVAASIKRFFTSRQPKETFDNYKTVNLVPLNCKELSVPKVNTEIWSTLSPKAKQIDYSHQLHQQKLSLAAVMSTKCTELIFSAGKKIEKDLRDRILRANLEVLAVLGDTMQDINQKRKNDIRPNLSHDIGSICSTSITTDWLFGENITEQLKVARSTSNALKSTELRSHFKGKRQVPYPTSSYGTQPLNFRGPPLLRGGGRQRRPFQKRGFSQRQQFNRTFNQPRQ